MEKAVLREHTRNVSPQKKKKLKSSASKERGKPRIVNIHDLGEENNELMLKLQETTSPMFDWSERRKDYRYCDESPSPTSDGEGSSFHQLRSEQKVNSAKNSPVRVVHSQQKVEGVVDSEDDEKRRTKVGTNFRLRPRHIVYINDYDFRTHKIEVQEGAIVDFRLLDVPNHAEHQLEGKSSVESLRFLSPVLQKGDEESFEFVAQAVGEVTVSCTLNTDMKCKIIVKDSNSMKTQSLAPLLDKFVSLMPKKSEEPQTISGVGKVVCRVGGYNSFSESYSSGVSDSDDESMHIQHGRESFNTTASISSDTRHNSSISDSFSSVKQVFVEQFSFRPSRIIIPRNTYVEFVPVDQTQATLDCDSADEQKHLYPHHETDSSVHRHCHSLV